jgi:hypothetical protein
MLFFLVPLHSELLQIIRDHVHYVPNSWVRDPRSPTTQKYFSQLFQVDLRFFNFHPYSRFLRDFWL